METVLQALINSPLLYLISLITVLILILTGKLKISSKVVSINTSAENERTIIRNQIEYSRAFCQGLMRKMPDDKNDYRKRYIIEMIYNEITAIISFNHLTTAREYVSVKQEKIWNIASTTCDEECYMTDEFKSLIFEKTEQLITELVKIRELASKNL